MNAPSRITAPTRTGAARILGAMPAAVRKVARPSEPGTLWAAMAALAAERRRQVEQLGHSREADDAAPLYHLVRLIRSDAVGAIESVQFNKGKPLLRRRLVRLGALVLAAIEKIDREAT
jgi:hypothetical protein